MIYIISHADSDGRFAAYCAYMALKSQPVEFHEVQYGNKPFPVYIDNLTKEDSVFILDFSYKKEILEKVNEKVGKLVVLDHHKSAKEELEGLPYAHFDMSKSGALLAWEYFNPGMPAPRVCELVNDRDLWTKKWIESNYLESWIRFKGVRLDWSIWDNLTHNTKYLDDVLAQGKVVYEVEESMIKKVFHSRRHHIGVTTKDDVACKFVLYNCPGIMHSEVAEAYYNNMDVDMTIGWRIIDDGKSVLFNLRSPGRVDVSLVAITIGKMPGGIDGGGHAAAAGAKMHLNEGLDWIKLLTTF